MAGDVGGPGRADGLRSRDGSDRHGPTRAHTRSHGSTTPGGRPRRRGLRLPAYRATLSRLWKQGPHRGAGRSQSVLVSAMSAQVPLAGSTVNTLTEGDLLTPARPRRRPDLGTRARRSWTRLARRGAYARPIWWLSELTLVMAVLVWVDPHLWPLNLLVLPLVLGSLWLDPRELPWFVVFLLAVLAVLVPLQDPIHAEDRDRHHGAVRAGLHHPAQLLPALAAGRRRGHRRVDARGPARPDPESG